MLQGCGGTDDMHRLPRRRLLRHGRRIFMLVVCCRKSFVYFWCDLRVSMLRVSDGHVCLPGIDHLHPLRRRILCQQDRLVVLYRLPGENHDVLVNHARACVKD